MRKHLLLATVVLAGIHALPQCTRCGPSLITNPHSLTFSPRVVGTPSRAMNITVANAGTLPFSFGSITASGSYSLSHDCGTQLPGHDFCHINVTFNPKAVGIIKGAITIRSNMGLPAAVVSLSGSGTMPLVLTPAKLNFGTVSVGNASASQSVTLINKKSTSVTLASISTTGDYHQMNSCPASLAAGASCTIQVYFHPTAAGSIPGALNVAGGASSQPISLSGTGSGSVTSHVSFSNKTLSFGSNESGTATGSQVVTLTNNSSSTSLTVLSIAASRAYAAVNTCVGKLLSPGASCSIGISFHPVANFTPVLYPGAVTVSDSDHSTPQVIGLNGSGVAPISASPSSINFGNVPINTTSSAKTVTLTNYHSTAETLTLSTSGLFALQSNSCGGSIPAGVKCSFKVIFSPGATTCVSGAVTFKFSSGGFLSPQVVSLSGCGI